MRTRFYCESCGREVSPTAVRCPGCGRNFTSVKCPQCRFEGTVEDFENGCPVCGYLQASTAGPGPRRRRERPARRSLQRPALSRRFYRVALIVLACLFAVVIGLLVLGLSR